MSYTRRFKRQKKNGPNRTFFIGAFDTETNGLDGELLLCSYAHESSPEAVLCNSPIDFLTDIFSRDKKIMRKTVWFSHNAEYDWRYLINHLKTFADRYDFVPVERTHGKFFQLSVYTKRDVNGKRELITTFRDSYAIYNQSLKAFTTAFCKRYVKQDIGLAYRTFDPNRAADREYAKFDVLGLIEAIDAYDRILHIHFGVHLKGTFSSTAYQACLRFLPDGEWHVRQSPEVEDFFRQCYFGGAVRINTSPGFTHHNVKVYDINSSYPANMRKGVPKGNPLWTSHYRPEFPGFYHFDINAPANLSHPILPRRTKNGGIDFRNDGRLTNVYASSIEIERALKQGYTDLHVNFGYFFPEGLTDCFSELVDTCERLRAEYKGTPTEIVVKYIQNSVYGKFGTKKEGREIIIDFTDICPAGCTPLHETMPDGSLQLMPYLFVKESERDAEYMMPHYAAWITANARLLLDDGIEAVGRDKVLYCDTDSIHILPDANQPEIGKRYGQFKLEKTFETVRYHAPKCYTWEHEGEIEAVYKGLPESLLKIPDRKNPHFRELKRKRDEIVRRLHSGLSVELTYHSSHSLMRYLTTGKFSTTRIRKSTNVANVKSHQIVDGKYGPLKAD